MSRPTNSRTEPQVSHVHLSRRRVFSLVVVLLLLYALLPQLGKFRNSFAAIEHSQLGWLVVALVFATGTSFVATGTYLLLAKKPLRYTKMLAVQFASLFASKLLPAGLGSLGLNFEYLRRQRHSRSAAGAVVATNNLVGLVGHLVLLGVMALTTSLSLSQLVRPHISHAVYWIIVAIVAIVIIILAWFKKLRDELYRAALGMFRNIISYRNRPLRLLGALVLSISLTSLYTACLWACAYAVGIDVSFGQALVVLTIGVAGSTAIPTPGGLGGAEAGLFAGLIAYKIPSAEALAIVLIYRLLTYWLALAVGTMAWIFIRHRNYI